MCSSGILQGQGWKDPKGGAREWAWEQCGMKDGDELPDKLWEGRLGAKEDRMLGLCSWKVVAGVTKAL